LPSKQDKQNTYPSSILSLYTRQGSQINKQMH
jgi:hypothetical protein